MYTVDKYNEKTLHLSTKHNQYIVPISAYKCLAGGLNNIHEKDLHDFRMIVDPEYREQEVKIKNFLAILESRKHELITTNEDYDVDYQEEYDHYQEEYDEDPFYVDAQAPTYEQYQKWYEEEKVETDKLRNKIRSVAKVLYNDISKINFSEYENTKGIKFIIQSKYDDRNDTRFCFDAYELMDNYHSNISDAYSDQGYGTDNGGWFKVHNKTVVLYGQSGDYGKYDDTIAKKAAEKLFPYHQIYSYSGRDWNIDLDRMMFPASYPDDFIEDDLPF